MKTNLFMMLLKLQLKFHINDSKLTFITHDPAYNYFLIKANVPLFFISTNNKVLEVTIGITLSVCSSFCPNAFTAQFLLI